MHAIKERATVVDGKIEIRPIMVVALTYDHRYVQIKPYSRTDPCSNFFRLLCSILDGREAVTFLVRVKQYIEDPRFML